MPRCQPKTKHLSTLTVFSSFLSLNSPGKLFKLSHLASTFSSVENAKFGTGGPHAFITLTVTIRYIVFIPSFWSGITGQVSDNDILGSIFTGREWEISALLHLPVTPPLAS